MLSDLPPRQVPRRKKSWRALLQQLAPLLVGVLLLLLATVAVNRFQPSPAAQSRVTTSAVTLEDNPAPPFRLTDQFGEVITLSSLRGRVVALTFLYTHCPDICSVTLEKFGIAHRMLGASADDVAFVAITVDPARDDVAQVRRYLDGQGLTQQTRFLTADRETLEAVWAAYQITVVPGPAASAPATPNGYEMIHSDRIYLIDRDGCLRRLLRSTAAPQDMLVDISGLLSVERVATEGGVCE